VFIKLVLPLSMPVVATIALFNAVGTYNDYMSNIIFVKNQALSVIQFHLYKIIQANAAQGLTMHMPINMQASRRVSPNSLKYAAMIITTIPIIIVYPFLQKHFMKGVLIGSVKG
jgi:putative aldouronate transport system permease protein